MSILSTPHDEIMDGSHTSPFKLNSILLLVERFYHSFFLGVNFWLLKIYDKGDSPKVELL